MLILTRERLSRGWSRQELSRRARLAPGDIGKFEAGRLVPYHSQLSSLATALDWPADRAVELLEEDGTTHDDH